jgi:hypothetical protein
VLIAGRTRPTKLKWGIGQFTMTLTRGCGRHLASP